MYYREKWTDGRLYYQTTPKGKWKPFSEQQYINRLIERERHIDLLEKQVERLKKEAEDEVPF